MKFCIIFLSKSNNIIVGMNVCFNPEINVSPRAVHPLLPKFDRVKWVQPVARCVRYAYYRIQIALIYL